MCDLSEVPSIFRLGIGEWEARDASRTGLEPVAQTATGRMCFIKYTGPLTGTRQMCESTLVSRPRDFHTPAPRSESISSVLRSSDADSPQRAPGPLDR